MGESQAAPGGGRSHEALIVHRYHGIHSTITVQLINRIGCRRGIVERDHHRPPTGAERGYRPGFAWVTAGLLANAALITTIGFIFSCTLCYLLAVQGLRRAAGEDAGHPRVLGIDVVTGLAISAPVFWTFTQFLAINLPGLTSTGWI